MKSLHPKNARFTALAILLTAVAVGSAAGSASSASQAAPPAQAGTPATIPSSVVAAAEKIANDPQVMALVNNQSTEAAAKARWNQFLELVRIPSPPRYEHLKAAEIHRRLVDEWGFSPAEVMTRADGIIAAAIRISSTDCRSPTHAS
jgi:thiamine pyrophosphate-dependent acetolactate synthase large subunit-like protein